MSEHQFSAEWCTAAAGRITELEQQLAEVQRSRRLCEEVIAGDYIESHRNKTEIESLQQRLAAAEAAARFYARYYDGPSEALLGEADRKAFQWIERAEKAGGWE